MKTFLFFLSISTFLWSHQLNAQVAINNSGTPSTDPTAMLEIKKASKSKLKIRSLDYWDTAVIELSNRNLINQGTDFLITARREDGLFFTTQSDLINHNNDSLFTMLTNGNIGIGTQNPSSKMDIAGDVNIKGALKINGSSGSAGQVLVSNGSGSPSWQTPTAVASTIAFSSYPQTNVTVNTFTSTSLAPYNELFDTGNNFDPVSGSFTAPFDGFYHFDAIVKWYPVAVGAVTNAAVLVEFFKNGMGVVGGTGMGKINLSMSYGDGFIHSITTRLVPGDIITFRVTQISGMSLIANGTSSNFTCTFSGFKVN